MANDNGKSESRPVFTAQTTKPEGGNIAVQEVVLKNVPTPLFVLFSYGGGGAPDFLRAAELKEKRLKFKHPDAEVRIIKGFEHPPQFKAEWTKLYNELTNPETANKYALWQVHYFGHGGEEHLTFREGNKIHFDKNDNMERLPWHPNEGIMVLHSCRGAAYEDTCDEKKIKNQTCLAKTISELQETRCLGQVTYGNNNALSVIDYPINKNNVSTALSSRLTVLYSRAKWEAEIIKEAKYRSDYRLNYTRNFIKQPVILWGYALSTNDTGKKILILKTNYETNKEIQNSTDLPKLYPIYEEVSKLADKNQILPCRVFNKGKLEERIVEVDFFNLNDLEYL